MTFQDPENNLLRTVGYLFIYLDSCINIHVYIYDLQCSEVGSVVQCLKYTDKYMFNLL
jgi:hypothetical protein